MFKGSMVAIVTPFKNGKVDEKALGDLIEFHIKNGTDVIVPCGTTGESATLSHEEHHRVVEFTVQTVNKRVPVIAGAGSNSTSETLELTEYAKKAGADGVLLITPYYNKPTQEGLYPPFHAGRRLDGHPDHPLQRAGPDERQHAARHGRAAPGKEEHRRHQGSHGGHEAGERGHPALRQGLRRDLRRRLHDAAAPRPRRRGRHIGDGQYRARRLRGHVRRLFSPARLEEALKLHYKLEPLHGPMFIETNPIPVKTSLALMGKITEEFRLPLCPMADANKEKLKKALKDYGLI